MSGNTIGKIFSVTTFGESHGPALGAIIDGVPPGIPITENDIQEPAPADRLKSVCIAAVACANKLLAAAILVITESGRSAFILAKYRPPCCIFAITNTDQVARVCHLHRAVIPVLYQHPKIDDWLLETENKIKTGIKAAVVLGHLHTGDSVIVMTGWRKGRGFTDTVTVVSITDQMIIQAEQSLIRHEGTNLSMDETI